MWLRLWILEVFKFISYFLETLVIWSLWKRWIIQFEDVLTQYVCILIQHIFLTNFTLNVSLRCLDKRLILWLLRNVRIDCTCGLFLYLELKFARFASLCILHFIWNFGVPQWWILLILLCLILLFNVLNYAFYWRHVFNVFFAWWFGFDRGVCFRIFDLQIIIILETWCFLFILTQHFYWCFENVIRSLIVYWYRILLMFYFIYSRISSVSSLILWWKPTFSKTWASFHWWTLFIFENHYWLFLLIL